MWPNPQSVIQAVFIIPPKVQLLDITGPANIFYGAGCYGAPVQLVFSIIFAGEAGSDSSCILSFNKFPPFDQLMLNQGDLVFVPGIEFSLLSDNPFLDSSRPFLYWLKTVFGY